MKLTENAEISLRNTMKRLFDIFLSSIGIIDSSPLWLLFSLAIILEDGFPIFYSHERVGKGGRIFRAMKFRSMIPDAEKHTGPVPGMEKGEFIKQYMRKYWLRII